MAAWLAAISLLWLAAFAVPAECRSSQIKIATLAPEGSTWMEVLHELDAELKQQTGGALSLKFYPGGVAGDEKDVLRKMRIGQMHAGGFTGVGLGEVLPDVRALDLPFLFRNDEEIEAVYGKLRDYFAERFERKGYVLLGWVPVGWIHFFSQKEIAGPDDLRGTKPWMWEGDPVVREAYRSIDVTPFPLSITDVLLSLQTGMIDTTYSSPLGALALQWFSKVKFMSQLRMGYGTGGVLVNKKNFDALPAEHQVILKEQGAKFMARLMKRMKDDNAEAVKVMAQNGVAQARMPSEKEQEAFRMAGEKVRDALVGSLIPRETWEKVLDCLKALR